MATRLLAPLKRASSAMLREGMDEAGGWALREVFGSGGDPGEGDNGDDGRSGRFDGGGGGGRAGRGRYIDAGEAGMGSEKENKVTQALLDDYEAKR